MTIESALRCAAVLVCAALLVPLHATAQQSAPAHITIPAGAVVQVALAAPLSSATSQQGDLFELRLAEPIVVDGHELVTAGVIGGGEVIDARPAGFGGRQGRLIVSGRFLEINGQRVPIRGMHLAGAGDSRVNTALGVSMVITVAGFFVEGGEIVMPAGTRGAARLAAPVDLPAPAAPAIATSESQQSSGENQQ